MSTFLEQFGWSEYFAAAFRESARDGQVAGRVIRGERGRFRIVTEGGERDAEAGGGPEQILPVAGDWVILEGERIECVLPRRTRFSRKQPGREMREQALAANVDVAFIVAGLDGDFNPRRLERYLLLAGEGGVEPVIVLNKADLCPDPSAAVARARSCAPGNVVILASALTGAGLEQMPMMMRPGQTAALVGSSGAGKSTIVNALLGSEAQRTQAVCDDGRGRHTTTRRELMIMPGGWLLMDMPGIRELQLWADSSSLDRAFADIAELASACRFRDCRHQGEPGCAVAAALESGEMDAARLAGYEKLRRELDHLERRQSESAALEQKRKWKRIHRMARQIGNRW